MNKKKGILSALAIIMLLAAVGCSAGPDEIEVGLEQSEVIPVKVEAVEKGNIAESYAYNTTTKGISETYVIPELTGKVTQVYFDIGDIVEVGDILYEVDYDLNQLDQQTAQVKQAYDASRIAYEDAKSSYEDMLLLYDQGAISKSQLDQTESGYRNAEIAYNTSNQNYYLTVDSANDVEDKMAIASPVAGIIGSVGVTTGNYTSSQSPAFTIADLSEIEINTGVTENIISKVKKGGDVDVRISALGDKLFKGEIVAVSPISNAQTGKYEVKIIVENDGTILSGMSAEAVFNVNEQKNVLLIPSELLNYTGDQKYVYVSDDDVAKEIFVEIGLEENGIVEVTEGLEEGDLIITEGYHKVQNGSFIRTVE